MIATCPWIVESFAGPPRGADGISGFFGGKLDLAAQRFVDARMAFPGLLLLLTIISIVERGKPQIIVVLGITGGIVGSRTLRGAVIVIKENDYFLAAKSVGTSTRQILISHVLPNIMASLIIIFSINIGGVVIAVAFFLQGRVRVHRCRRRGIV